MSLPTDSPSVAPRPLSPATPTPEAVLAGLRPAWVGVDLERLEANLRVLRSRVAPARVLAVIKADAYGHGAVGVGRALAAAGADMLGVALVEEGIELRRGGVAAPILVLGTVQAPQAELVEAHHLVPTVSSAEQLRLWTARAAARPASAPPLGIHLKVDTGMSRLGFPLAELGAALDTVRATPGLQLAGLLSHLAASEDLEGTRTAEQEALFADCVAALHPTERGRVVVHLGNSAGALHHPGSRHAMVRTGLALFGLDPAGRDPELLPVMSLTARIVQLREVPTGAPVGYGGRWRAPRPSRIAVVPVGYADGYSWRLSNHGAALVAGRRVPVVGAVSMDMTTIDVTDVPAEVGSDVVLLGEQGGESIDARELAAEEGTLAYEVLCLLGLRLPRCYLRGGRTVEVRSRLAEALATEPAR